MLFEQSIYILPFKQTNYLSGVHVLSDALRVENNTPTDVCSNPLTNLHINGDTLRQACIVCITVKSAYIQAYHVSLHSYSGLSIYKCVLALSNRGMNTTNQPA